MALQSEDFINLEKIDVGEGIKIYPIIKRIESVEEVSVVSKILKTKGVDLFFKDGKISLSWTKWNEKYRSKNETRNGD